MPDPIARTDLLAALMFLMEETFEGHPKPGNYYLDSGTGWSATLAGIDAETASRPVVDGGTTIAGHVEHTRFYLGVFRDFAAGRTEPVDWAESWLVSRVSEEEWASLKRRLTEESEAVRSLIRDAEEWDEDALTAAIGMISHCAYHLGAARQMVRVVREPPAD